MIEPNKAHAVDYPFGGCSKDMFPTAQDCEAFRSEFGPEGVIHRMTIPRRGVWGTQVAAAGG